MTVGEVVKKVHLIPERALTLQQQQRKRREGVLQKKFFSHMHIKAQNNF